MCLDGTDVLRVCEVRDPRRFAVVRDTGRGMATSNVDAARAMLQLYPADEMVAEPLTR